MAKIPPPPPEPKNPHGRGHHGNNKPARTEPQKNVCPECGYHNSHGPKCSKR